MRIRRVLALVLVASAALFALGSQIERNTETGAGARPVSGEGRHVATRSSPGEQQSQPEASGGDADSASKPGSDRIHKEASLFGINTEAVGLVIAAVLASLLLALAVWMRPIPLVYVAAVAFGLVFAGFDVREVLHQIDESRAGLIAIAALLAGLHLLVAALAASALLRDRSGSLRARSQAA
jgi:hypothetical protein